MKAHIIQKFIIEYTKIQMVNHMKKFILHKVLRKQMIDIIFLKQKKFIKNQMKFKKLLIKEDQMEKPQDLLKKKMPKLESIIKKKS